MFDYTIFYKTRLQIDEDWSHSNWDLFFSAYNDSERVKTVFSKIAAYYKEWILFHDYAFEEKEYPSVAHLLPADTYEASFIYEFFLRFPDLKSKRICIDITGFMRPHLIFLLKYLKDNDIKEIDFLYSEPERYSDEEKTKFSDESVREIRQIAGFEGSHNPDSSKDILIIGSGYDHMLIAQIAEYKEYAKKIQIFGLPSLQAIMYQENVLRALKAEEYIGATAIGFNSYFAPANDPFVTAAVLSSIVKNQGQYTNLYLCPVSTKPQALGFALYYLTECIGKPVSIIFPFTRTYSKETSKGISRIWKYTVEFT